MCKGLMEQWWGEFVKYCKRDQISFPYVMFKNGLSMNDIVTLGSNVYKNPSFRITTHL